MALTTAPRPPCPLERLMPAFSRRFLWLPLLTLAALGLGCQQREPDRPQGKPEQAKEDPPPATPGLELQADSYAKVRDAFRTKLVRKGPAPQKWGKVRIPPGVREV